MAYNQIYDTPNPGPLFATPDLNHPYPSAHPMASNHGYSTSDGATMDPNFDMYEDRQGYQGTGSGTTEEAVDSASRPRLTQEQLAELETQFALHHKPNTDYKKSLAENMGVDYSKVNNWFQNRRAKAKHENQAQLRSDPSFEDQRNFLPEGFPPLHYRRASRPHQSVFYSSPEQDPVSSEEFPTCLEFSNLNDPHMNFNTADTPLIASMCLAPQYNDEKALLSLSSFSNNLPSNSLAPWPTNNNLYGDDKFTMQSIVDLGSLGTSPESPPVQSGVFEVIQGNNMDHSRQIYQNSHNGNYVGNPSSHSFVTSPSDEDDQAKLITPPQETSPLPGLNQATFQHDRRTSNDSELAENFDTIHLQHPQAGLDLFGNSNTAPTPDFVSQNGLLTPVITPDTADSKLPFARGHDLATRRNRRPPKLHTDSGRSVSYAGSRTSPHLRVTPPGSGKMSPVRRIKSTGNNLNVVSGRVKKQGTSSAQMSPRNFEACFQSAAAPENKAGTDTQANGQQLTGAVPNLLKPSSPVPFVQQTQVTWNDATPQYPVPPSGWDQGTIGEMACNREPEHGIRWTPTHNDNNDMYASFLIQQNPQSQQYGYHCPPQSAPSHVTTFDAASSMAPTSQVWHPPHLVPESYRDDTQLPISVRPFFQHHHSHSGPTSQLPLPPNPYLGFHPSMPYFQPFQQYPNRAPTPVLKPLDIKVETGPSPPKELAQASQERKEYTFQNSFSHDPDFATSTKK